MREYGFTLTEHDPQRPWIVVGSEHRTITLADGTSFFEWAHEHWPTPRWSIELDPWALTQRSPRPSSPSRHIGGPDRY
jgi:hypothetical protein